MQEIGPEVTRWAVGDRGYALYVGLEFKPKGDPAAALRQTFAVCHQG